MLKLLVSKVPLDVSFFFDLANVYVTKLYKTVFEVFQKIFQTFTD